MVIQPEEKPEDVMSSEDFMAQIKKKLKFKTDEELRSFLTANTRIIHIAFVLQGITDRAPEAVLVTLLDLMVAGIISRKTFIRCLMHLKKARDDMLRERGVADPDNAILFFGEKDPMPVYIKEKEKKDDKTGYA